MESSVRNYYTTELFICHNLTIIIICSKQETEDLVYNTSVLPEQ